MGKGWLDLEEHYAFFGAYHSNPVNVLIHTFFLWPIFFSSLILFYFTRPLLLPFTSDLNVNFGFFYVILCVAFYIAFDKKAGSLAAVLCFLCWFGSQSLAAHLGFSLAWKVVLATQVFCWSMNIIGHLAFERAPALLDNLPQALLMGPFFILLEVLDSYFGYEPYPGFRANVHAKTETARKQWLDRKQKKTT